MVQLSLKTAEEELRWEEKKMDKFHPHKNRRSRPQAMKNVLKASELSRNHRKQNNIFTEGVCYQTKKFHASNSEL